MTVDDDGDGAWTGRVQALATVAAPASLVAALLFYFGYVATSARYAYFGIDLTALDLSFADLTLLGTEVVYIPFATLVLLLITIMLAHRGVRIALGHRSRRRVLRVVGAVVIVLGAALFVRGVLGVLSPGGVAGYLVPGLTPLAFGLGLPLAGYGAWLFRAAGSSGGSRVRRRADALRWGLITGLVTMAVLGLFWSANTFAGGYGRGRAETMADELHRRPAVVLDTQERLYLTISGVRETVLPSVQGQRFRYRYRGLHLLTEAGGRLFLVPGVWSGRVASVVVPYDETIRVQFIPR